MPRKDVEPARHGIIVARVTFPRFVPRGRFPAVFAKAAALLAIAGFVAILSLPAADPLYERAQHKLDSIEMRQVRRGARISFTPQEINAWARVKVPETVPEGITDERVELGNGTAIGYATVDFLKMRQGKGKTTNWLFSRLLEGERPLAVSVRLESAGGGCTVYLTRVELSGAVANATVLDFLIKTFFMPLYPDAKINEPFDLDYDMESIDIRPSAVVVTIKK
jgi:hypothetical protein